MGGCATKPKILKGDDAQAKAPEPPKEELLDDEKKQVEDPKVDEADKLLLHQIVDDDPTNKRPSLSSLFHQKEDEKVSAENEKAPVSVEETATQETPDAEKPSEDSKCHEILKQESADKASEEIKSNELIKEESPEVEEEKKPSEESQSREVIKESAEVVEKNSGEIESNEVIKRESSEENQNNEAAEETKQEILEAEKPREDNQKGEAEEDKEKPSGECESNDTVKQEHSEIAVEETIEKVIQVVEEAKANAEEKSQSVVEEAKLGNQFHLGAHHK